MDTGVIENWNKINNLKNKIDKTNFLALKEGYLLTVIGVIGTVGCIILLLAEFIFDIHTEFMSLAFLFGLTSVVGLLLVQIAVFNITIKKISEKLNVPYKDLKVV